MSAQSIVVGARSGLLENPAWIHPDDDATAYPSFLNMVAVVETDRSPLDLLDCLLEIESALGRQRDSTAAPWQPRTIDIDLLAFDDRVLKSPRLVLPHPRMHERDFVLKPLVEICPDWRHPIFGKSATALLEGLTAG